MPIRKSHSRPRPEVPKLAELPQGIPAAVPDLEPLGRPPYAKGSAQAKLAGARGGRKKAGTTALASRLGLAKTTKIKSFAPYRRAAENFARLHVQRLAELVGNGSCGPGPSSVVMSAALQLAASRYAFEVSLDHALGSRLADASRANLLSAVELCSREARARANRPGQVPQWRRDIDRIVEENQAKAALEAKALEG